MKKPGGMSIEILNLDFVDYISMFINMLLSVTLGYLGGSVVKKMPANAGDTGWIPGLGRSPVPQSK